MGVDGVILLVVVCPGLIPPWLPQPLMHHLRVPCC